MMRTTVSAVLAAGVMAVAMMAWGGAAPAPAAGGESVAAMKERLTKLKAEEADLAAKIAAAEVAAAGKVVGFVKDLNGMPANLWPAEGESDMKRSVREKWLDDNMKPGKEYEFTGTVAVATPTTINEPDKPARPGIQVLLDCGTVTVWGKEVGLHVSTVIDGVKAEDAMDWNDKTVVTVKGKMTGMNVFGNPMDVKMDIAIKK